MRSTISARRAKSQSASRRRNTANGDAIGALSLLDAIRILKLENKTRFYQASTSELYGKRRPFSRTKRCRSIALALWRGETLRLLDHGELS